MRLAIRLLLAVSALAGAPAGAAAQATVTPAPDATSAPQPILWLRGPFGTVPSGENVTLDAFVRSAPLRLETGDPDVSIGDWRASFHPLDSGLPPLASSGTGDGGLPSTGVTLAAPDAPGTYRLDVSVSLDTGTGSQATWTMVVPDRPLPPDGLIEVPAPVLLLSAGSGTVAGWAGSGCHIYLCVDVGRLPPLRTVTHADVVAGEELRLRLSDDSGITAWTVTLYPIVSGLQPAMDEIGDEPDAPVDGFVVQAPVAGEWLMQAEVTYDRLRGWTHAFYRLTSHAE
jgi:hypothetical protein